MIDYREVLLDNGFRVATYMDVTGRVKAEEALRRSERRYKELSIQDDLTGLYNKRHLNSKLQEEIQRSRRHGHALSLLLLDIDDFKGYNDTYGHTEGDHVLARMGAVLIDTIRQTDSSFRYGGEEFVVMLPETTGSAALEVAERIRSRFENEYFSPAPDRVVKKTVSVGVAEYLPDEDVNAFLARADECMYQAKRSGKNRAVFA